ncbi:MAG: ArsR/SmtB family transcription factor [Candidatus Caccovivens sp.]
MNKLLKLTERNKYEIQDLLPDEACTNKLALYFQNFSDQTRIKILSALSIRDLCVNDLSKLLGINQTTISHQLKTLKDQNIVEYRRDGKILIYRIKSPSINEMMLYAVKVIS